MSSRARLFAAVTVLAGCLAGSPAWAQATNLEAGKSASQLFSGTCNACHKSPRGLLKTVSPGSLPGFLREHYTTSGDMASQLSSYLISNGASDPRQAKQGSEKPGSDKQGQGGDQADRQQGRKNRNAPPQETARPDDAATPSDGGRQSRKRVGRQGEPSEDARAPAQATIERGPDGRKPRRSGRPAADEPPAVNEPARTEPARTESAKPESPRAEPGADGTAKAEASKAEASKGETSKGEAGTAERAKPDVDVKPDDAKIEVPKNAATSDKPVARSEPAPAVTPAPSPAASASTPAGSAPAVASPEPAPPQPKTPAASEPPAVTASAPPPPPPSGPPAPPISR